jgi:hypothetical protein
MHPTEKSTMATLDTDMKTQERKPRTHSLSNFIMGIASVWPSPPPSYTHPTGGGFRQDRKSMQGDFSAIGRDMRKTLKRNDQAPGN